MDPFNGSGTTCVVANKLGVDYLGVDISEAYCKIARRRLERTRSIEGDIKVGRSYQLSLFDHEGDE